MSVVITGNNTPTAGGVTYGDGTTYATTAAGTSGQVLTSAGASAPAWATPSAVNLTTGVTGTLPIANGGTNSTATATAGGVGYGTGTAHAFTAAGTSGQVLTSAAGAAPTWTTPSSGAMTLISTQTVSAAAAISFTGLSGYSQYILMVKNIYFSADTAPMVQIGTGASPTWVTSSYTWTLLMNYGQDGGSAGGNSSSNAGSTGWTSGVLLSIVNAMGASTASSNSKILISNFNTSGPIQFSPQLTIDANGYSRYFAGSGYWANATALSTTAIRLLSQSGVTITGTASLYGISS